MLTQWLHKPIEPTNKEFEIINTPAVAKELSFSIKIIFSNVAK